MIDYLMIINLRPFTIDTQVLLVETKYPFGIFLAYSPLQI